LIKNRSANKLASEVFDKLVIFLLASRETESIMENDRKEKSFDLDREKKLAFEGMFPLAKYQTDYFIGILTDTGCKRG
jgi:hypothetical protein